MAKKIKKSKENIRADVEKFSTTAARSAKKVATAVSGGKKSKKSKRFVALATAVLTVVLICLCSLYYFDIPPFTFDLGDPFYKQYQLPSTITDGVLRVHFIDVGQGDSILIQFPDGKNMLIDGGKNSDTTADKIIDYIRPKAPTLDYLMLTHTDSDHSGSLDNVVASDILVKKVFMPKIKSTYVDDPLKALAVQNVDTGVYKNFVEAVVKEGAEIAYSYEGMNIEGEDYRLSIFSPNDELYGKNMNKGNIAQNRNNVSPICILYFNGKKIMFTGDADESAELSFLNYTQANHIDTDVDILKVAHHGGKESTNKSFLDAVKPEQAVISVGKNTYGHPTPEALNRLRDKNCKVYRTDEKGNTVLTVKNETIGWFFEKDNVDCDTGADYEEGITSMLPIFRFNNLCLAKPLDLRS